MRRNWEVAFRDHEGITEFEKVTTMKKDSVDVDIVRVTFTPDEAENVRRDDGAGFMDALQYAKPPVTVQRVDPKSKQTAEVYVERPADLG